MSMLQAPLAMKTGDCFVFLEETFRKYLNTHSGKERKEKEKALSILFHGNIKAKTWVHLRKKEKTC